MSDTIKYSELAERITKKLDTSPENIEKIRVHMGELLYEALEKDGSVHLNGFGTFYMKWSEAREGINPQTQERIEIPGHNYASFRPDAKVRKLINKKYENHKAIILDDSGEKETVKIPKWAYAVPVVLIIAVIALLLNPREVTKEVVVEEIVIEEVEVPVIQEKVVTKEVEVPVIQEKVVTNVVVQEKVVVKEVPVEPAKPKKTGESDILEHIAHLPDETTEPPPMMAEPDKGPVMASIAADDARIAAQEAVAQVKIAEGELEMAIADNAEPEKIKELQAVLDAANKHAIEAMGASAKADEVEKAADKYFNETP